MSLKFFYKRVFEPAGSESFPYISLAWVNEELRNSFFPAFLVGNSMFLCLKWFMEYSIWKMPVCIKREWFSTKKVKEGNGQCEALGSSHFSILVHFCLFVFLSCLPKFLCFFFKLIKLGFLQPSIRRIPSC